MYLKINKYGSIVVIQQYIDVNKLEIFKSKHILLNYIRRQSTRILKKMYKNYKFHASGIKK